MILAKIFTCKPRKFVLNLATVQQFIHCIIKFAIDELAKKPTQQNKWTKAEKHLFRKTIKKILNCSHDKSR